MFKKAGFSESMDSEEYGSYVLAAVDKVNSRLLDVEDELLTGTSTVCNSFDFFN